MNCLIDFSSKFQQFEAQRKLLEAQKISNTSIKGGGARGAIATAEKMGQRGKLVRGLKVYGPHDSKCLVALGVSKSMTWSNFPNLLPRPSNFPAPFACGSFICPPSPGRVNPSAVWTIASRSEGQGVVSGVNKDIRATFT